MSKFSLSEAEKDVLSDIFYHEGLKPLLKVLNLMVQDIGSKVLSADINDVEAARREYDGAKKLYAMLAEEVRKRKKA